MSFPRLLAVIVSAAFAFRVPVIFGKGSSARSSSAPVHVNGYTKANGTYVAPHDRRAPNSTKADNWSTKGNVNPETGKEGTKNADATTATAPAAQATTPTSDNSTATPKREPSSGWKRVHAAMTKEEVQALLGDPNIKTEKKWGYVGGGLVSFDDKNVVVGFMAAQ